MKNMTLDELMDWWAETWDGQPACAGDSCAQAFYEEILKLRQVINESDTTAAILQLGRENEELRQTIAELRGAGFDTGS